MPSLRNVRKRVRRSPGATQMQKIHQFGVHAISVHPVGMASIYDPRYAELRRRLREARLAAGMTQVEAAQALGTNQQYINRCEAGDRRIDFLEVVDFAALYAVPLESFGSTIVSSPTR